MNRIAKWFMKTGSVLVLIGVLLTSAKRIRLPGRLPGDLAWKVGSRQVRIPLGTSALMSLLLALYLNLSGRRR